VKIKEKSENKGKLNGSNLSQIQTLAPREVSQT